MGRHGAICTGEVRSVSCMHSYMLSYCAGKKVSEHDERIPGGLKYRWASGTSTAIPGQVSPTTKITT